MICKCLVTGLHSALLLITCLGGIAISLPAQSPVFPSSFVNNLVIKNNQKIANSITVKILSQEFIGTGIIINKQVNQENQTYTIITNNHVLMAADKPVYQIQTPDGKIYLAKIIQTVKGENDLGILQFTSNQNYQVTKIGNPLTVGEKVFANGFTNEQTTSETSSENIPEKKIFTQGYITLILDKPLEGGYQIGYTNDVYKGMSGGPLLNIQGKLVGINGVHKNPLWEVTELYADGSQPCQAIQDIIPRNSWAIPIKTVEKIIPELVQIPAFNPVNKPLPPKERNNSTILQMQQQAENVKKCILPKKDHQEIKK
ncbi:MAG: serine protease [Dolichospermum sp.]